MTEPEAVVALRRQLMEARYPETFPVTEATMQVVESHLSALQKAAVAEWRAAGEPTEWHAPLVYLYAGRKHFGVLFKGVEIYVPQSPDVGQDVPGGGAV